MRRPPSLEIASDLRSTAFAMLCRSLCTAEKTLASSVLMISIISGVVMLSMVIVRGLRCSVSSLERSFISMLMRILTMPRKIVKDYLQKSTDDRLYTEYLVRRVADIDFVLTETEKEALILENNLIKQFKHKFNINLRDDKTFISIKLEVSNKFPYPKVVRRIENDGAMYFGPYASSRAVRETLRYINDTIPIRKCPDNVFKNRVKPCLYYQIYKCLGPCCDLVDEVTYQGLIDQVVLILKGKQEDLIGILKQQMYEESRAMRYEKAAKTRDRIRAIEETVEKQRIHSMTFVDRDVFGYYMEGKAHV